MGPKRVNLEFFIPGTPKGLKRHRTYRAKSGTNVQVDPSKADKIERDRDGNDARDIDGESAGL